MLTHRRKSTYLIPIAVFGLLIAAPLLGLAQGTDGNNIIVRTLYTFVVNAFGLLMAIGASILNYGVNQFVIGFGDWYGKGLGVTVNLLWTLVRDFFNLFFIFGLLYIGFRMILDSENANSRRWLVSLIIAALLVNFSLYITKVVVDFSNILATEIAVKGFDTTKLTDVGADTQGIDFSGAIQDSLGLPNLFGSHKDAWVKDAGYGYVFGTAILLLVAAFVYAAGGIILIIRFAVLTLYIILSPLMFIGWVFPALQSYTSMYWRGFLSQSFLAPAYLLLLAFANAIIASFYRALQGTVPRPEVINQYQQALSGADGAEAVAITLPPFILACIFLIAAIVIAKKMSDQGATASLSLGKKVSSGTRRIMGGVYAGVPAWVGRKMIGGTANRIAESSRVQRLANSGGASGLLGRGIADAAHYARTSSFDVRNIAGAGKAVGAGEGKKGGYAADLKAKEKREKERSDRYATNVELYKDAGEEVAEIKAQFDELLENIDEIMAELSRATDPEKRRELLLRARELQDQQKDMEDNVTRHADGSIVLGPDGKPYKDPVLDTFNYIRKNNKVLVQNMYAANLERRNRDFGFLSRILQDQQANAGAADSIRKEASKSSGKKALEDMISKQLASKQSDSTNNQSDNS